MIIHVVKNILLVPLLKRVKQYKLNKLKFQNEFLLPQKPYGGWPTP